MALFIYHAFIISVKQTQTCRLGDNSQMKCPNMARSVHHLSSSSYSADKHDTEYSAIWYIVPLTVFVCVWYMSLCEINVHSFSRS